VYSDIAESVADHSLLLATGSSAAGGRAGAARRAAERPLSANIR
jgi:hypothetical protein